MPTTSRTTDGTSHLLELMKKGDDAFNSRDFAAMEQFFRIFPDVHVNNDPYPIQFGSGDWITVITRVTGTFTGEMTLPDGNAIPPTGKAFDVQFSQTVKWNGDRVIEISAFWDSALQAQQIGLA